MNIDWNKKIKFNINFNNNAFKRTLAANIFSFSGLVVFLFYCAQFIFFEKVNDPSSYAAVAFIIILLTITIHLSTTIISLIVFFLNLKFKYYLKNKLFSENRAYTAIFYIGLLLNILIIIKYFLIIHQSGSYTDFY